MVIRVFTVILLAVLTACTALPIQDNKTRETTTTEVDPDALSLQRMASEAEKLASHEISEPVLREISTDLGRYTFYFTDANGEQEVDILVPDQSFFPSYWITRKEDSVDTRLQVSASVDIPEIRTGPYRIENALIDHWPGCGFATATLFPKGNDLVWNGYCRLQPSGRILNGEVSNKTRQFFPLSEDPASKSPTERP